MQKNFLFFSWAKFNKLQFSFWICAILSSCTFGSKLFLDISSRLLNGRRFWVRRKRSTDYAQILFKWFFFLNSLFQPFGITKIRPTILFCHLFWNSAWNCDDLNLKHAIFLLLIYCVHSPIWKLGFLSVARIISCRSLEFKILSSSYNIVDSKISETSDFSTSLEVMYTFFRSCYFSQIPSFRLQVLVIQFVMFSLLLVSKRSVKI